MLVLTTLYVTIGCLEGSHKWSDLKLEFEVGKWYFFVLKKMQKKKNLAILFRAFLLQRNTFSFICSYFYTYYLSLLCFLEELNDNSKGTCPCKSFVSHIYLWVNGWFFCIYILGCLQLYCIISLKINGCFWEYLSIFFRYLSCEDSTFVCSTKCWVTWSFLKNCTS